MPSDWLLLLGMKIKFWSHKGPRCDHIISTNFLDPTDDSKRVKVLLPLTVNAHISPDPTDSIERFIWTLTTNSIDILIPHDYIQVLITHQCHDPIDNIKIMFSNYQQYQIEYYYSNISFTVSESCSLWQYILNSPNPNTDGITQTVSSISYPVDILIL